MSRDAQMVSFLQGGEGHIRKLGGDTQYRLIYAMKDGRHKQVLEHRYIMEQHIGRPLIRGEVVHHKDSNGLNNAIDNLQLMTQSEHQRVHLMTGPRKWPLDEAIQLRDDGWTLAAIADKYGVSWTCIRKAFAIRGVNTKRIKTRERRWDIQKARGMMDAGMTISAISQEAGVTPQCIRQAFKKLGWR